MIHGSKAKCVSFSTAMSLGLAVTAMAPAVFADDAAASGTAAAGTQSAGTPDSSPAASTAPTGAELIAAMRTAKAISPDRALRASLNAKDALVTTVRMPSETDRDCKIDAVLLAKALIDAYPAQIVRVKVLISDLQRGHYSTVSVSKGDVKSYGSGAISIDDLLNSIEISTFKEDVSPFSAPESGSTTLSVAPGIMQDKRLVLLGRIAEMQKKGTNMKMFMELFDRIEDAVKQGNDTNVPDMIQNLSTKLNEQERMREQANTKTLQASVLAFQAKCSQFILTGRKLPFATDDLIRLQNLVTTGRFAEASNLMQTLQRKMR